MNSDQQMIATQAQIISKHRKTIQDFSVEIEQLKRNLGERYAERDAWRALQKQITASTILQSEWDRFLGFLRLAGDDEYVKVNYREKHRDCLTTDISKCLQSPGLYPAEHLLDAASHIERFLTIFREMEEVMGVLNTGLLESHITCLRKTAEIVLERKGEK